MNAARLAWISIAALMAAFAWPATATPAHPAAVVAGSGRGYGNVRAIAFHPDGSALAVAGSNRRIAILGGPDWNEQRSLFVPGGNAHSLAFSADGRRLAAGGNNRIFVWDSASGEPLQAIDMAGGPIVAVTFAPQGSRLAAAGANGAVKVFEGAAFTETAGFFTEDRRPSRSLAFSPDGQRLAGNSGRHVRVWNPDTGEPVRKLTRHTGEVSGVAFASTSRTLASGANDGALIVWDLDQGEPRTVHTVHEGRVFGLAASGDGRLLATAGPKRTLLVHRADNGEPLHHFGEIGNEVSALALSSDAGLLAAGFRGMGQSYMLWRLQPQTLLAGGGRVPLGDIEADYLTQLEKQIIQEHNLARTDPMAYAEFAKAYRRAFQGKIHVDGRVRLRTQEGVAAVDEAIAFLENAAPVPPLAPSEGLSRAAADHVKDSGPRGRTGHTGSDGSQPAERMARHGEWKNICAENIAYGPSTARSIVLQLIIDDGVPDRGHRDNIFNPKFRVAGVHVGPHRDYNLMCVITYAGGFE